MEYVPAWNANMAAPAGGFTAGALLAPNYLQRLIARGGEEAPYYERIALDANDIEGSFRAGTGYDIRQALRDVAPGFDPGPGPITAATLDTQVSPSQTRAPSKGEGLAPLALLAPAVFGIAAWAAAGGAAGATAAEPELAASSWGGLTAQQAASLAGNGLKLAGAVAPALAASRLAGTMAQRSAGLPAGLVVLNARDGGTVTEQEQQNAPQSNSGSVPPTYISGGGAGGVILAIVAVIAIALMKG